ncbi:GFA family protein [Parasphingorhabdus sp.]|uniref:GFA family protein n=1 Tax=Parasphingorhabdus sp. TaxID=2709688 RepID=UPI003C768D3B
MTDNSTSRREGHCLCGAVKITAKQAANHVGACHCRMCRRWGGGPFLEIDCGTDVLIKGAEKISVYNSSDWAERAFCSACGTNLFYRLKGTGEHMVCAGIFDDADNDSLTFKTQVFIDEKPAYYSFAEDTDNMTGEELFAMIEGGQQE